MDKIEFSLENGEKTEFYVLEQTRLGGCDYILVTDTVDEEEGGSPDSEGYFRS